VSLRRRVREMWLIVLVCALLALVQLDWLESRKKPKQQQRTVTFWVQVRRP